MIVDVSALLKDVGRSMRIDETETVSYPEDNLILASPVHVRGELVNAGEAVFLKGKIETVLELNCGRCAKMFDCPVNIRIEEEYGRPSAKIGGKDEIELKEKDFVFEVQPDNTINISEAVRQDLLTEIPIQPLCDEKCSGL